MTTLQLKKLKMYLALRVLLTTSPDILGKQTYIGEGMRKSTVWR